MKCRERLEVYLREHQVLYQLQHHTQAFSAQKIAESEHMPGKMVAKTVIGPVYISESRHLVMHVL
jgi:Ala-tRNA(Pro) deacylase